MKPIRQVLHPSLSSSMWFVVFAGCVVKLFVMPGLYIINYPDYFFGKGGTAVQASFLTRYWNYFTFQRNSGYMFGYDNEQPLAKDAGGLLALLVVLLASCTFIVRLFVKMRKGKPTDQ